MPARRPEAASSTASETEPRCPLCDRPIPPAARSSLHHLVPKLKGGRNGAVVRLHQICHSTIHATLSETELARRYASIEALKSHPEIARFVAWVQSRPAEFHARTRGGRRKRR